MSYRPIGLGIGTLLLILITLGMCFLYKKRLHTLSEDRNEKNRGVFKAVAVFVTTFTLLISLFQLMDSQEDVEYKPFLHDFCLQIGFAILGIFCPLHFYKDTPNFFIYVKSQMFHPPSLLPWEYSNETMELISHAKHLSDQFYLDLLWRENTLNNRDIILKELNRIKNGGTK